MAGADWDPSFFLSLFNPLSTPARQGRAVPLGHHFWEAKSIWGKAASTTEPCASSEWCPMEVLEAILGVDGSQPTSLQGSGLSRCLAVPAVLPVPRIREALGAMGCR